MNRRLFDVSQLFLTPDYVEETLYKKPHDARSVAFNRSGTILAVGCADGAIVLWDFETRSPIKTLTGHTGTVSALTWSRNGRRLLSASHDGTVAAWKVETGALEWQTQLGAGEITSLSADDYASALAAAMPVSGAIQIIKLSDGSFTRLPLVIPDTDSRGTGRQCVIVSKDGTLVLVGQTRATIVVYDASNLQVAELFKVSGAARSTRISQLVLSQRGDRLLALCSDRMLRLYNMDAAAAKGSPRVTPESACGLLSAAQGTASISLIPSHHEKEQNGIAVTASGRDSSSALVTHLRDIPVVEEYSPALAIFDAEADHVITAPSASLSRDHEMRMYDSATGAKTTLAVASASPAIAIAATPQHRLSSLTSVTAHGHVYIWGREYRENWSAFAPRFQELSQNEEYNEREDEFDSNPREEDAKAVAAVVALDKDDDVDVDIMGRDDFSGLSDASDSEDGSTLRYLPVVIEADPDLLKYDRGSGVAPQPLLPLPLLDIRLPGSQRPLLPKEASSAPYAENRKAAKETTGQPQPLRVDSSQVSLPPAGAQAAPADSSGREAHGPVSQPKLLDMTGAAGSLEEASRLDGNEPGSKRPKL